MKFQRRWFLGTAGVLLLLLAGGSVALAQERTRLRWDIISLQAGAAFPGGLASAWARGQPAAPPPGRLKISMNGSGTFSPEDPTAVTGGGGFAIQTPGFDFVDGGAYRVTGLVLWIPAPGTTPVINRITGTTGDFRAGIAVFTIAYSDGSRGVLTVGCNFGPPAPAEIFEGISVTKGLLAFTDPEPPNLPGTPFVDWNRTVFTVLRD